nr:YdcF family protein [uncultured Caproiciproducens sp.]
MNLKKHILKILILILSVCGLIWFVIPIHWSVLNIGNAMGMIVCVLVLLTTAFSGAISRRCKSSGKFRIFCRVILILFCAGVLWSAVLTGLMIYGAGAGRELPQGDATVVVLGSKVSGTVPSADLRVRIETAAAYLKSHPQAKCIVSGGQGKGELVTEASVMREYLVKDGIDTSRILTEDASVSTEENLKNSLVIVGQKGMNRNLAIVTDDYHQYRAGRIAAGLGITSYPVCAPTPWYIFSSCYARELLALTNFLVFL